MNDIVGEEIAKKKFDLIFMAAAVADYRPEIFFTEKILVLKNLSNLIN